MTYMNMIFLLLLPVIVFAVVPVGTPKETYLNVPDFEAKANSLNAQASKNEKIKCRVVCDKKIYKEQKIEEAILFYKNSKDYKFTK